MDQLEFLGEKADKKIHRIIFFQNSKFQHNETGIKSVALCAAETLILNNKGLTENLEKKILLEQLYDRTFKKTE